MVEYLSYGLEASSTLAQVKDSLLGLLGNIKRVSPKSEIWFISGVITAEGPEFRSRNRELIRNYGEYIRNKHYSLAFSAVDVFSEGLIAKVKASGAKSGDFTPMWLEFIKEGKDFLTGIITTPRWQNSPGSVLEVATASRLGLKIIQMEEELLSIK